MKKMMCLMAVLVGMTGIANAEVKISKKGEQHHVYAKGATPTEVFSVLLGPDNSGIPVYNDSENKANINTPGTGLTGDSMHDLMRVLFAEHYNFSIVLEANNDIARVVISDKKSQ